MPVRPGAPEGELAALMKRARNDIASRISEARVASGLSQPEVAAAFNRSTTWVSKVENGEITPRADHLLGLCDVIGADPAVVLTGAPVRDSWFLQSVRQIEPRLDERALSAVLALARIEASTPTKHAKAAEERGVYSVEGLPREEAEAVRQIERELEALGDAATSEDDGRRATRSPREAGESGQGSEDARGGSRGAIRQPRQGG